LNVGQKIELEENSAHYVRTVLRLKKEQMITLFNGKGDDYLSVINEVSKKRVVITIKQCIERNVESPLYITLGLGISRGDRMDWAVQKSVELGVNNLTPLMTERCVVKFTEKKQKQRLQHWKSIVQHATEQCSRTILPMLEEIESIKNWLNQQKGLKIFLDPYATQSLTELTLDDEHVTLLIGPEGGFTEQERDLAIEAGFVSVKLGGRVLRTETAAIAALSAVQMLWGDFL
jgi:16S rRNA (uracil1498-N3)-methyltransferase